MSSTLLTAKQAAIILGVDPRTVRRQAKAGKIPCDKLEGARGAYVFALVDLEAAREARG